MNNMNKENISMRDLDLILDKELKVYLSLEHNIFELMAQYEKDANDILKDALLRMIFVAKQQNTALLGILTDYYSGDIKLRYSNSLRSKLDDLKEIESNIVRNNKTR